MNLHSLISIKLYAVLVLFVAFTTFLQVLPISTYGHYYDIMAITSEEFVCLSSLFFISYSFMQLPCGIILDRYGIKYLLPGSILISFVGIILYWQGSNSLTIGIGRLITGLGCSIAYVSGVYIAAMAFDFSRLPLFIGLLEASASFGPLLAARPLGYAIKNIGWSNVGFILYGFCLCLFLLSFLFLRKFNERYLARPSIKRSARAMFHLLKDKRVSAIFGYSFCTWAIFMSFAGYWIKPYMEVMHNFSENSALALADIYWASFLISSLVIGKYNSNIRINNITILFLSIICTTTYTAMYIPILFSYNQLILVAIFGGISTSGVTLAFALITKYVPRDHCGVAIAMNNTFIVLGGYSGQVLFGMFVKNIPATHLYGAVISKQTTFLERGFALCPPEGGTPSGPS